MANVVSTTIDMECGSCIIVSTFLPPLASPPPRRRVDLSHEGRGGPFILQKQPYGRMPPSPLAGEGAQRAEEGERSGDPWTLVFGQRSMSDADATPFVHRCRVRSPSPAAQARRALPQGERWVTWFDFGSVLEVSLQEQGSSAATHRRSRNVAPDSPDSQATQYAMHRQPAPLHAARHPPRRSILVRSKRNPR